MLQYLVPHPLSIAAHPTGAWRDQTERDDVEPLAPILLRDGIVQADTFDDLERNEQKQVETLKGVLTPRTFNAHTHFADSFLYDRKDRPTDVPNLVGPGGWKLHQLATATPETLVRSIYDALQKAWQQGVGGIIDFREGGPQGIQVAKHAESLARQEPGFNLDCTWLSSTENEAEAQWAAKHATGLAPSGIQDFPTDVLDEMRESARKAGKPFAIHFSEPRREDVERVLSLEPEFLVHVCKANDQDLRRIAEEQVPVVVCPRSNHFFGLKSPIEALDRHGIEWAVGTDNGMLATPDPILEWRMAKTFAPKLTPERFLHALTVTGWTLLGEAPAWPPQPGQPYSGIVIDPARFEGARGKPQLDVNPDYRDD